MKTLPYAFPETAFCNGIASMPWFDLMQELAEINADSRWQDAKDIQFLQNALFDEIGAVCIGDALADAPSSAPPTKDAK